MRLAQIVFRVDSLTYLIAHALSTAGHRVQVWVTDPEFVNFDPYQFTERLSKIPHVSLCDASLGAGPADRYDRLIVQMFPRPQHMWTCSALHALAARSEAITLITSGDRSLQIRDACRLQWRELRLLARWVGRIDRVVYKDGPHRLDLFSIFKSRQVVGFDVHSSFMANPEAFAAIEAQNWGAEEERAILINFMGSQDPQARKVCLDAVRGSLHGNGSFAENAGRRVFWHEYSDAKPASLSWRDFLDVLTRSDFTLCPPGYSLLTHRVIEALLRGSAPVLHRRELNLYDLDLRDGVNCVAVDSGSWPRAVERILKMNRGEVCAMRRNIRTLVQDRLLYPVSSRRMRARLGADG